LEDYLSKAAQSGAGELFLQSIDRDGMRTGLDLETARRVRSVWNLHLILAGGVGHFEDLLDGFQSGAEGIACGTLFNFGDNNPIRAKAYLRNFGVPLKLSS
jgi:cyclase